MPTPDEIVAGIAGRLKPLLPSPTRQVIALAGPPGSGKSTIAAALATQLNEGGHQAGLVAMDGFHLDNAILAERGLEARKGSPDTFDLAGFASILTRLAHEDEVIVPRFDRTLDASIGSAIVIGADIKVAIVEGNYLLLDQPGWRDLAEHWTYSVFLDVELAELERRLMARWLDAGLDAVTARRKVEGNDLPNARFVIERSRAADYTCKV